MPDITVSGVVRTAFGRDVYDPLLKWLATQGYSELSIDGKPPTLFVFAYDWRLSNADHTQKLKALIDSIRSKYPGTYVDILAHSMGGLLARRYILNSVTNHSDHYVRKLITIGSPWLGAPKAIVTLEAGNFISYKPLGIYLFEVRPNTIRELSWFFPGAHELLPSEAYFKLGGRPLAVNFTDYSYTDMVTTLDNRYPFNTPGASRPATAGKNFHVAAQDDFKVDPGNVEYRHILGVQKARRTIEKVRFLKVPLCFATPAERCILIGVGGITLGYGDETVPRLSAERIGSGQNLNASGVVPIVVASNSLFDDDEFEHLALINHSAVKTEVTSALKGAKQHVAMASSPLEAEPAFYLKIYGVNNVSVADSSNHTLTLGGDSHTGGVPAVSAYILGDYAFSLIVPTGQTYEVTFRSGNLPIRVELTKETDTTYEAVRYVDLVVPSNVIVKISFTPQGFGSLKYDKDGDGVFETEAAQSVVVSGATAQDVEPPLITIGENRQSQNATIVTVNATDSGAGVKIINYSLDGTNYQPYLAPFSVDPHRTQKIYAFADDNVANRSGVVEFKLTAPPLVMVEQGTTSRAVALDSVNWLRAPFPILNNFNFSVDRRTRVILFISGLALTTSDSSLVTVQAAGLSLPVETVGTVNGVTGLNGSFIVVRLPDGLPSGELPLTIAVGGVVNSNTVTLSISPSLTP